MAGNLQPLFDAREGKPTEKEAARVLAIGTAIPGTLLGIIAGLLLVPASATFERLLLTCSATALGFAVAAVAGTLALYRWAGLRPLVIIFDAQMGAYAGLLLAWLISGIVDMGWWTLLLCPIAALAFSFMAPRRTQDTSSPDRP